MSYTPTNWVSGDIVTSEKLNKLENGVANAGGGGGGALIVHVDENGTLDKTWQEIHDAAQTESVIFSLYDQELSEYQFAYLINIGEYDGTYYLNTFRIIFADDTETIASTYFTTSSANGYPVITETE